MPAKKEGGGEGEGEGSKPPPPTQINKMKFTGPPLIKKERRQSSSRLEQLFTFCQIKCNWKGQCHEMVVEVPMSIKYWNRPKLRFTNPFFSKNSAFSNLMTAYGISAYIAVKSGFSDPTDSVITQITIWTWYRYWSSDRDLPELF
jgi:hypothetical protein